MNNSGAVPGHIKIIENGPYLVTGSVPLSEKVITPDGDNYLLLAGRELPQAETYALCRCGRSQQAPFCDGSHLRNGFDGTETADRSNYADRAELLPGPALDLLDDERCACTRFCYRRNSDAWELTMGSDDPTNRSEAIQAASECLSGRLTALDKNGKAFELDLEAGIAIVQDPEKQVSAGLFVSGGIQVESSDGILYESRNRQMLCRCGQSDIKPFCDGTHVDSQFQDNA